MEKLMKYAGGIIVVGAIVSLVAARDWLGAQARRLPAESLEKYERLRAAGEAPEMEPDQVPYRTGKVLLVTAGVPEMDRENGDLDEETGARRLEDAQTLIFCERTTAGASDEPVLDPDTCKVVKPAPAADQRVIGLTVIDLTKNALVSRCRVLEKTDEPTLPGFARKMPLMSIGWRDFSEKMREELKGMKPPPR